LDIIKDNTCVLHYPILNLTEWCYGETGEVCNRSILHPTDVFGGLAGMSLVEFIFCKGSTDDQKRSTRDWNLAPDYMYLEPTARSQRATTSRLSSAI
jgi:hypothetical protein